MIEKTPNAPSFQGDQPVVNENGKRSGGKEEHNAKKRIKGLYRQPTTGELNRLYETENLFNSNLFRMQIEEILQEVKVSDKVSTKFQKWFENFKSELLQIPENNNEYDLNEVTFCKELKVKLPVSGDLKRTKCTFKFYKFSDIEIIGSYSFGASINAKLCVDLQITVPAETYAKKDSINYRYHKKRAAYLAYLASFIKKLECVYEVRYAWENGLETKPFLTIKPNGKIGNFVSVKLDLSCEPEAYKFQRFQLTRNNLRESWLCDNESIDNDSINFPTPFYNSSVLYDLTSKENNTFLRSILENGENLKQAIVLLKIWLRQRHIEMSGFVITMFVAHLVDIKRINNIMSSYQIVRNVWISLKTSKWDTEGLALCKMEALVPTVSEYLKYFPVVLLDRTGYYNICWQMCIGTYNALRRESALAVEMLDNTKINSFIPLFMVPFNPILQFDHILRFKDIQAVKDAVYSKASIGQKLNYGTDILAYVTMELYSIISQGLGGRAELIQHIRKNDFTWSVKKSISKSKKEYCEELSFGFVLNAARALENVKKGPSANLPEAEEFRAFWGEKSTLRRFKDGSMTETCFWEADSLADRRDITKQIIQYLLQFKFGINTETFYISNQLDSVLISKQYAPVDGVIGTGEELTIKVLHAFDALKRDLRALVELPLDIASVYGISPVFSYMDPFPSMARNVTNGVKINNGNCFLNINKNNKYSNLPPYTPVYSAVIELGHSGKWPGDLEAFRALKAAFHVQISDCLKKQFSLVTQPHPTHINILKNGVVFRLEIVHSKEVTLLKRKVENGVVKHRDTDESIELTCKGAILPKLRGAMHGLHQKYPAYGPTTTLVKRFLSSHLIDDDHFPHVAVELLVGAVFLNPEPLSSPFSPLCGFMRVLNLLFTRDWNETLLVNFDDNLSSETLEMEKQCRDNEISKSAMRIITPYDGELAGIWTKRAPTSNILARVILLAKSAYSYIEESLMKNSFDNVLNSFLPPKSGYDITISLHSTLVPRTTEGVAQPPTLNPDPILQSEDIMPVLDFNPVEKYVQELRSAYGQFALFFYDMYGGDTVSVLWKPDIKNYREFQIVNAHALKPIVVNNEVQHVPNVEAIIEDFRIIGQGLVENIEVHNL